MSSPPDRLASALASRYKVERELGRGGMATVYLARDLKHDRLVALKVLLPELSASLGSERFLREINVTAGLSHPHILPLYDSGEADGFVFYVMPYVEGESLRDRMEREGMLPVEAAVQIAKEVAEALQHAHEHGVVHRDIKPANIQLVGNHPLVADFGISRAVSAAGGTRLTQTGMAVGTPAYMSPEQANGSEDLDGRTDVYSLGCVLYEMLVGEAPFSGSTPQALLARHSLDQVSRPRIVRPTIPEGLEDIVLRALAKLPVDRFRTAGDMAEALTALSTGTYTPFPGTRLAASRPPTFRGVWPIAGVITALVLVTGYALRDSLFPGRASLTQADALDPHRIAILYFQDRSPDGSLAYLAEGLTESLIDRMALVRGLDVISSSGVARYAGSTASLDSIARFFRTGTVVEGEVEPVGDRFRVTARLVDGPSGAVYERMALERPQGDLLTLRDSLAVEISRMVRQRLGEEIRLQEMRSAAGNAQAWSLVHRARKIYEVLWPFLDQDSVDAATRSFEEVDSLLAEAERLDPAWPQPILDRAWFAYERSQWRGTSDRPYTDRWTRTTLAHVERALAIDPSSARALQIRGTARYWRWLMGIEVDADAAATLFADAEADLRASVALDRGRAGAWEILSHLLLNKPGAATEARLAAQRAYEADAYMQNVDRVVERLWWASYDLNDYVDAAHWCEVGAQRFPSAPRFKECQIWLMSMVGGTPDPDRAWELVDEYVELNREGYRPFRRLKARMATAAVLARAGMADSARAVIRSSLGDRSVDPAQDTYMDGAFALVLLGDHAEAVAYLREWAAANPARAYTLVTDDYWWWRDLQGRSDFQALSSMATRDR